MWIQIEEAHASLRRIGEDVRIVVDPRLPVPAAATAEVVLVRPDATEQQVQRAIALCLLARTDAPFTERHVAIVEKLLSGRLAS